MLTGVVIAKNESDRIARCLDSLSFCDEVIVMDNDSVDDTGKIAKSCGAKVHIYSGTDDFSAIRNAALRVAKNDWVLFVDADEVVPQRLQHEILHALPKSRFDGYFIRRRDYLWGKFLDHGDVGGVSILRLGRKSAGKWRGKVHETWDIKIVSDDIITPLEHYPHKDIASFLMALNHYSKIRAEELHQQKAKSNVISITFYPIAKFIYLWIFRAGFLDGTAGFVHAAIMSFYSFLVRGKLFLLDKGITDSHLRSK